MNKIITWVIGIVAVVALGLGLVGGNNQSVPSNDGLKGMTNLSGLVITPLDSGDGLVVGTSGTNTSFSGLIGTSCNLLGMNVSHAASTTKAYDCAVTGLTSSYNVVAQLATSTLYATTTQGASQSWYVSQAKASTTAGFATVMVTYFGGASIVPSSLGIGSSTAIWAFK